MEHSQAAAQNLAAAYQSRDPFALCKALDILVLTTALPNRIEGFFTVLLGHRLIYLNENMGEQRRREVCAHELGHALLHPHLNHYFLKESTQMLPGKLEREADLFAAYLLIDDSCFHPEEEEGLTLSDLACRAGVDERLMALRLGKGRFYS